MYPGVGRQICIRARYIENTVGRYLKQGKGQVVSLAAGLSTYPYRAKWISNIQYYAKVDLPDMAAFKEETISCLIKEGAVSAPRIEISHLQLDITDDILIDKLHSDGWNRSLRTVFIIAYYVSFQALAKLLQNIARTSCSGSIVIMDYFPQIHSQTNYFKKVMGHIAKGGEITMCCPTVEEVSELFKCYRIISDIPDPKIEREYYTVTIFVPPKWQIL